MSALDDHGTKDHLRALHAAYTEASGRKLSFSPEREKTLREFDRRGLTPEDVRGVVSGIQQAIRKGLNGFTEASLDWRNCMHNVDVFEDRAARFREAEERRKGARREAAAKRPQPVVQALPDGTAVARLAELPPKMEVPLLDVRKALRKMADDVGKGGQP